MSSAIPTPNQATSSHQTPLPPSSPPNKRDLKSWWKGFKLQSKQPEPKETRPPGIFGVPLRQSITYANVAISLIDENGQSYIYGYVPIVVAKCGVFLKEKATGVEGIFRLSGSEKRIKELKNIFDSPDRYGKGLVWDGYTVHDAATVLRRYLNDLPEPVVPLDLYEKFRDPLRGATKQAVGDAEGPQFVDNFDEKRAIEKYQKLITELPPLNRQLLLYILDLLAVFAAKSDENRMNSQNLAAIFQPGMLSHPTHAMAPEEYRLNQCVIIFLIENQDHFLIGMQGTASDEKTIKEVEAGTPALGGVSTSHQSGGVARSSSNASAGAVSVRKEGQLRRNRSVSSKHSKNDGSSTPNSPAAATTPTGGLGRSNTVPSKRSPALGNGKFKKADSSGHSSSAQLGPLTPARKTEASPSIIQEETPSPAIGSTARGGNEASETSGRSHERLLEVVSDSPASATKEKGLPGLFQRLGGDVSDKRQPNKLKKKRIPGALSISAHSSNASLNTHSNAGSPSYEVTNPLESMQPISQTIAQSNRHHTQPQATPLPANQPTSHPTSIPNISGQPLESKEAQFVERLEEPASGGAGEARRTPPGSVHSNIGASDGGEDAGAVSSQSPEKEKKRRWRLSSRARKDDPSNPFNSGLSPQPQICLNEHAEASTTSFGSSVNRPRKSSQAERSDNESHEGTRDPKGPIGWIKHKYREAKDKENADQKQLKLSSNEQSNSGATSAARGQSVDFQRDHFIKEEPLDTRDVSASHASSNMDSSTNKESKIDVQHRALDRAIPSESLVDQSATEAKSSHAPALEIQAALPQQLPKEDPQKAPMVKEEQPMNSSKQT